MLSIALKVIIGSSIPFVTVSISMFGVSGGVTSFVAIAGVAEPVFHTESDCEAFTTIEPLHSITQLTSKVVVNSQTQNQSSVQATLEGFGLAQLSVRDTLLSHNEQEPVIV
jgi:hypothetical protein